MAASKTVKDFAIGEIYADYDRNYRHAWKYKVEPLQNFNPAEDAPGFYEDVLLNGIHTNIEVAELTSAQQDELERKIGWRPKARVIRGHRRFKCATIAHESDSSLFKKLTCIVYKGLTEKEELQLMFDHVGVEPLDDYELFNAVRKLFGSGLSQEAIGSKIGQKRGWVQDRIYLMECPPAVAAEYLKRFIPVEGKAPVKGKDYVFFPFSGKDSLDELHKRWNADKEAKIPADSPASTFKQLWDQIMTKTVDPKTTAKKALSKVDMDKRAGLVSGREGLEAAHQFYNGDGGDIGKAVEIYDALERSAAKVPALESRVRELEDQVAELQQLLDEKMALINDSQPALNIHSNGEVHVNA